MAFPDAAFGLLSPALIYSSVATVFSVFGAVNGAVNFALFRRPDGSLAAPAAKPAESKSTDSKPAHSKPADSKPAG